MRISRLLDERKMTKYRLSKESGVPYSTIEDLLNGKTSLKSCSAGTLYQICRVLEIPMEELLAPEYLRRTDFENFKSSVCHELKQMGDIDFLIDALEANKVQFYYDQEWYPEALYMLAMIDYISRINGFSLCREYDFLRGKALPGLLYPQSVEIFKGSEYEDTVRKKAVGGAIPEFMRHNIVEGEVRDVI